MKHRDPVFQAKVDYSRRQAMRVIADIRNGKVNEEDIDMLQNFVQFSLALMQAEGPKKWELAKMNAELINYMKGDKRAEETRDAQDE